MRKQFLGSWLVAGLAVVAFGACGDDDDDPAVDAGPNVVIDADTTDAEPGPDAKPFCQDPIDGLDPACAEGGEVRMERVIGPNVYRVTSFLKSAQDDVDTPAIIPPGGIGSCFTCDADSDMWACTQAANRVYEQAGQLTISAAAGTDIVVDHCTQGAMAMGAYQLAECGTDPGVATGISPDAFTRTHPDGAYIDQATFVGTAVEATDSVINFAFAGDAAGYPASDFDVYLAPDFTTTPVAVANRITFTDGGDLEMTWDMPAAPNLPAGTSILMSATFIDDGPPPNAPEGISPTICLMGVANPGGGEQTFTIPAATVANLPNDGVVLRGAVAHTLAEYNDGTVRERRIDQVGMNCFSNFFTKEPAL